jgi:serine/threonine protein phosphatase 1
MITFVVPDIHGAFDILQKAMDQIDNYNRETPRKVVFLGDYIDRGPCSAQVIAFVREGISSGKNWIALKGNHEDFMARAVCDNDQDYLYSWIRNGGEECLSSYGGNEEALRADAEWAKSLPLYHVDQHRVYVHAFAPHSGPIESADPNDILWKRYPKGANFACDGRHIVHGHTPQPNWPELLHNRTNLDCGAVFGGFLCVGVFDDTAAGGPVDLIKVQP